MSQGQIAIAELQRRFGARVDPKQAFELIDATLANGHAANLALKQVICAAAFDRGMLFGMLDRVEGEPCGGDPLWEVRPYLDLPIAPDDPPPAAAPPPPSRIILPGH